MYYRRKGEVYDRKEKRQQIYNAFHRGYLFQSSDEQSESAERLHRGAFKGSSQPEQLKKGEPYEKLKKCIHVSILDFNHFPNDEETGEKYTDLMEIKILELRKLQKELKEDSDILNWMRFLGGKKRREFEDMAKKDEYIGEAFRELERLSADEKARLEYEAREKAIRDYNSQTGSALRRGMERGLEQGRS